MMLYLAIAYISNQKSPNSLRSGNNFFLDINVVHPRVLREKNMLNMSAALSRNRKERKEKLCVINRGPVRPV